MRLYDTARFTFPLPPGHRFPVAKYRMLRESLWSDGLGHLLLEPPRIKRADLLQVHEEDYVDRVLSGGLSPAEERRIGLPWSRELAERALRSCGATLAACLDALGTGIGVSLAGGGHHALPDAGRGYCVLNDLAVAVRAVQARGLARRVLIVDCDVHQGDGTARIFAQDRRVFTLSVHARGNFPFPKAKSDLDIELPDGSGDGPYLEALQETLPEVFLRHDPDLIVYVAGADPYERDTLGRLRLTRAGLEARDRVVIGWARRAGIPVAITMGGGYADPLEDVVGIHRATVRIACAAVREGVEP